MAGIFPGLLFGLCLVVLVLLIARKRNFPRGDPISLRDSLKIALDSIWGLVTMVIIILLLALGTFMDLAPMLLICTPILLPMIIKLGVDPVHFGMIMLINLGIGLITPPVGPTLFVGCAIGK